MSKLIEYDVYDLLRDKYLLVKADRHQIIKAIGIRTEHINVYCKKGTSYLCRYVIVKTGEEIDKGKYARDTVAAKEGHNYPEALLKDWDRVTREAREYFKSKKVMACNR